MEKKFCVKLNQSLKLRATEAKFEKWLETLPNFSKLHETN